LKILSNMATVASPVGGVAWIGVAHACCPAIQPAYLTAVRREGVEMPL